MLIVIPGKPRPQARHRSYFHGARCHYVDPSCRDKKLIRLSVEDYLIEHFPDFKYFEHPRISCIFQFPYPKTRRHILRRMGNGGLTRHMTKPDVDNLLKLVLDALTGILYKDDKTVSIGPCVKTYSDYPKTVICVEEMHPYIEPWEFSPLFCHPSAEKKEIILADKYMNPADFSGLMQDLEMLIFDDFT